MFIVWMFSHAKAKGKKRAREPTGGSASPVTKKSSKKGSPPESKDEGTPSNTFKGYDLREVPTQAWPQPGINKGAHGYTIKAKNGAAI